VPAITNNNIYNNSYNAETFVSVQTSLPDNWWGTTNTQAINQSIYDFKDDFNLGTVNFVPFLTAPNPQAPVFLAPAPTSTPTPSASPTPAPSQNAPTQSITISTPTVPELSWLVIVPLFLSVFSVAVIVRHRKTNNLGRYNDKNFKVDKE